MSSASDKTEMAQKPSAISSIQGAAIRMPCGAAAPLVANGGGYVGCSLTKDHDGPHEVNVRWNR